MVYAEPESLYDPNKANGDILNGTSNVQALAIHGGQNVFELVTMLQTLQHNILHKLAMT